jgi:uncharacterized protein (TIGR02145 family)
MPGNAVTVTANFETSNDPPYNAMYAVIVSSAGTGATGGGRTYEVGATVTITAGNPPAGQQFKNWTTASNGVIFANANSPTTTFTMPANAVTVTANFEAIVYGNFKDDRDGQVYRTVPINGKMWMADNLNYVTDSSWCHGDADSNCIKYGRLYTWNVAMNACPLGWHLSTRDEWNDLVTFAGGSYASTNKRLKSQDWDGTNDYGFSALPGGMRYQSGNYVELGLRGNWWTSREEDASYANYQRIYTSSMDEASYYKSCGMSVRCVQD